MNVVVTVYEHLKHIGVPANLSGYKYLQLAIGYALEDPEIINSITKTLYPQVARACNSTPIRVERSIRHAIEYVFSNTDVTILKRYFGNTYSIHSGKLSNSQFIAGVAEHIRMEVLKNDEY